VDLQTLILKMIEAILDQPRTMIHERATVAARLNSPPTKSIVQKGRQTLAGTQAA
jgi:hypothetical protein